MHKIPNHQNKILPASRLVFVDTSAIIAVINRKDQKHKQAKNLFKALHKQQYRFVLTNFVIAETHALLLKKTNVKIARDWLVGSAYKFFNVLRPEEDMEMEAVGRIDKYKDKDFSLTDMLSFLVMEKGEIKYYFAYDEHFTQIGLFNDILTWLNKS